MAQKNQNNEPLATGCGILVLIGIVGFFIYIFSGDSGETNQDIEKKIEQRVLEFNSKLTEKQKAYIHNFFISKSVSPSEQFQGVSASASTIISSDAPSSHWIFISG